MLRIHGLEVSTRGSYVPIHVVQNCRRVEAASKRENRYERLGNLTAHQNGRLSRNPISQKEPIAIYGVQIGRLQHENAQRPR